MVQRQGQWVNISPQGVLQDKDNDKHHCQEVIIIWHKKHIQRVTELLTKITDAVITNSHKLKQLTIQSIHGAARGIPGDADCVYKILGGGQKYRWPGGFLARFSGIEYSTAAATVTNAYLIHSRRFHVNKSIAYNLSLGNELRQVAELSHRNRAAQWPKCKWKTILCIKDVHL